MNYQAFRLTPKFLNLPSPHVTPQNMLQLYHKIQEEASQYDGIVITHGTDTLEETAYFLDTMDLPTISVILTGAMRSSNELEATASITI